LGAATADDIKVQSMLFGALGCNLAWGIIDGGIYLLARLNDRGRKLMMLQRMRIAPDLAAGQRIISDALPPLLASVIPDEQLEMMRQKLRQLPDAVERAKLTKRDLAGAFGILLLSFLSTFPIVIPFIFIGDARLALRVSNTVAIVMLFICGYLFGHRSGLRPWATGLSMVAVGGALVGVAIALGG
jgi:VIT1/CCC1 family predicted Fe2+/Mn2+ transporter